MEDHQRRAPSILTPQHRRAPSILAPHQRRAPSILTPQHRRAPSILAPQHRRAPSILAPQHRRAPSVTRSDFRRTSRKRRQQLAGHDLQHGQRHEVGGRRPEIQGGDSPRYTASRVAEKAVGITARQKHQLR